MVIDHADGAIQLFTEDQSRHGMRQGQAGKTERLVGLQLQGPVSYTHLDVYKRQFIYITLPRATQV